MTEISYYWEPGLGDAIGQSPYSADLWNSIWRILFTSFDDDEGVVNGVENGLEVSGASGGTVSVDTGVAVVHGSPYKNPGIAKTLILDAPVSDPRIDIIVLKKDWGLRTIRMGIHKGVENAAPVAPTLTQTDGLLWEIPLASVQIETDLTVAVTDSREFAISSLTLSSPTGQAMELIETQDVGGLATATFSSIPQTFKHLRVTGLARNDDTGVSLTTAFVYFNGDQVNANYNRQIMSKTFVATPISFAFNGSPIGIGILDNGNISGFASHFSVDVPNYIDGHHKMLFQNEEIVFGDTDPNDFSISREAGLWKDTAAITQIEVKLSSDSYLTGSTMSLWGIRG